MKKVMGLLILAGLALGGCSNNDCEDAADKLKECGLTTQGSSSSGDCSGASECAAKCINNASCEQLKGADLTSGTSSPYIECLAKCG